jgi:hypothetical protein
MVSMAFGIFGLAACLCCKDVDSKMTNKVSTDLSLFFMFAYSFDGILMAFSQDRGIPREHRSLGPKQVSLDSKILFGTN